MDKHSIVSKRKAVRKGGKQGGEEKSEGRINAWRLICTEKNPSPQ